MGDVATLLPASLRPLDVASLITRDWWKPKVNEGLCPANISEKGILGNSANTAVRMQAGEILNGSR